ncbi:MAG: RtcB family protein, partial [Desulfosudaceae bacterium]
YREVGQPVLIPGDMGTSSYVLVGGRAALTETFGSTCHGAGRIMSRTAARKSARGRSLFDEMRKQGVTLRCAGKATAAEEMPEAYKDVEAVVEVAHQAGISTRVARIRPLIVVKG